MAKTLTMTPSPADGDGSPATLMNMSSTERLQAQVGALLMVSARCENLLVTGGETGSSIDVHEGSKAEAAKTYELAQLRLRDIIDDTTRWTPNDNEHDRLLTKMVESNLVIHEAQKKNLEEFRRPSKLYNANLRLTESGWLAWIGSGAPDASHVHALGNTPAEAFRNLDKAFLEAEDASKLIEKIKERSRQAAEELATQVQQAVGEMQRRKVSKRKKS